MYPTHNAVADYDVEQKPIRRLQCGARRAARAANKCKKSAAHLALCMQRRIRNRIVGTVVACFTVIPTFLAGVQGVLVACQR